MVMMQVFTMPYAETAEPNKYICLTLKLRQGFIRTLDGKNVTGYYKQMRVRPTRCSK
jgi:hypothetical protein